MYPSVVSCVVVARETWVGNVIPGDPPDTASHAVNAKTLFRKRRRRQKIEKSQTRFCFVLRSYPSVVSCVRIAYTLVQNFGFIFIKEMNCNEYTIIIKALTAKLNAIECLQSVVHKHLTGKNS